MKGEGDRRKRVGRRGEDIAAAFLVDAGHTVLARNWRAGHLELDIVSMAADGIHFVEVKSRVVPMAASPEDSVGPGKMRRMAAAAGAWLSENGKTDMDCYFDVVSVSFSIDSYSVEYFPQAFIPIGIQLRGGRF